MNKNDKKPLFIQWIENLNLPKHKAVCILIVIGCGMNLKPLIRRLADFFFNMAVASVAVSAFEGVWYGIIIGAVSLLLGVSLSVKEGGWYE